MAQETGEPYCWTRVLPGLVFSLDVLKSITVNQGGEMDHEPPRVGELVSW